MFPPTEAFSDQAVVGDPGIYERAERDWTGFWAEQAGSLDWFRTWDTVLEWDLPFARWFDGGTLNVSYNCLDRHVAAGRGDTVAFHWEGEPGDTRHHHLRPAARRRVPVRQRAAGTRASDGATGWPCTCP